MANPYGTIRTEVMQPIEQWILGECAGTITIQ